MPAMSHDADPPRRSLQAASHAPVPRQGPGGLPFIDLESTTGTASVCLQGGQLTHWRLHADPTPVIWTSSAAQFGPGKRIRGGIPICWPWFGPHATNPELPAHGFARNETWVPDALRRTGDGAVQLLLHLPGEGRAPGLWPYRFELTLRITLGTALEVELATTNRDDRSFLYSEALHTYFQVGDIESTTVLGLDGAHYADTAEGGRRRHQAGAIVFPSEVDRVYVNSQSPCAIIDPVLHRRIVIEKTGSLSTVVWNPWSLKAARLGDLGPGARGQGGWREMLCIESGNALENAITLAPGQSHRLVARYRREAL